MQRIDYGPAPADVVALLETMRRTLSPERRLLMVKLLSRTVAADGDDVERATGEMVDQLITEFFKAKEVVESRHRCPVCGGNLVMPILGAECSECGHVPPKESIWDLFA